MESQDDDATSPQQRAASVMSGGRTPSVASSSLTDKPGSTDDHTQVSTSEHGSMGPWQSRDLSNIQHIEPYEATICQDLTHEFLQHLSLNLGSPSLKPHGSSTAISSSLEDSLRRAALVIRYNAKWFAPDPFAALINAALQAAAGSSSSKALFASLQFIDTINTYVFIPAASLPSIARFLALTYYRTSRANKTKKVAAFARAVAVNILRSHLGPQLDEALLECISEDLTNKDEFTVTAGALMLLVKRLRSKKADLPLLTIVTVLRRLRCFASKERDAFVMEYVLEAAGVIVGSDKYVEQMRQDAGWEDIITTLAHCQKVLGQAATEALQGAASKLSEVEPRLLPQAAWLYAKAGLPLIEQLPIGIRTSLTAHASPPSHETLLESLKDLAIHEGYHAELQNYIHRAELVAELEPGPYDWNRSVLARIYSSLIQERMSSQQARSIFSRALINLFLESIGSGTSGSEIQAIFDKLCEVSDSSIEAANLLFRVRSDIAGTFFIAPRGLDDAKPGKGTDGFLQDLDIGRWLSAIIHVLHDGAQSWEIYECFLQGLKRMLSNHLLFKGHIDFVKSLQDAITVKIEKGNYVEPPQHTGLGKSHVAALLVQILTASVSYHRQLDKNQITGLVALFDSTAGSRDYIVSIQCIHALTVCCYEVPDIMTRYMDDVIDKMSRMVTQRYLAIHVIQFLIGLSRLRDLYRNFTAGDYKKIFAVCNIYLQTTRSEHTALGRKGTPTSEASTASPRNEDAFPEYVYAIAHHAITFWYQNLKRQDREVLKPYIASCLTYKVNGKDHIEDQGLVTIDAMDRVDARDGDEVVEKEPFTALDGRLIERHRLIGMLLVSTKTSLRTGRTLVTVRRPSGTMQRMLQQGRTRVTVDDEDSYLTVMPDDPLGRTYGAVSIPRPSSALGSLEVITLPEDDGIRRAIAGIDRTSALDSHKAGVIYIGEGQRNEERILQNVSGSPDYREFLRDLGDLERLQNAPFNAQGLDRADNTDGEFTIVWHNRVTEMVYHIITMMPNSSDPLENTARKKRHIGNDHVNIVFNNSGVAHDFTTLYTLFPSQFATVYIIITPSARTSFMQTRTTHLSTPKAARFYSVEVVARPDYPNISSAADAKVVSGASLGGMVRNLALNECIMTVMWTQRNGGGGQHEYPSSWRSRMEQLRRLGDRYKDRGRGL